MPLINLCIYNNYSKIWIYQIGFRILWGQYLSNRYANCNPLSDGSICQFLDGCMVLIPHHLFRIRFLNTVLTQYFQKCLLSFSLHGEGMWSCGGNILMRHEICYRKAVPIPVAGVKIHRLAEPVMENASKRCSIWWDAAATPISDTANGFGLIT